MLVLYISVVACGVAAVLLGCGARRFLTANVIYVLYLVTNVVGLASQGWQQQPG
jgi:hypothetical protein